MNMQNIDFIKELGEIALGSRLKRLSDLLFAGVEQIYKDRGVQFQPKWFPTFNLLKEYGSQSILEIALRLGVSHAAINQTAKELLRAGLVSEKPSETDKRKRILALTAKGLTTAEELEIVLRDIRASITETLHEAGVDLIEAIDKVENQARKIPLFIKARNIKKSRDSSTIEIIPFETKYEKDFEVLNTEWISKFFHLEDSDKKMLPFAKKEIVDPGGQVLFARNTLSGRIVGCCALKKYKDGSFELTKMAVTESAQGQGIGRMLAKAMISYAKNLDLQQIFLETNSRLTTAIQLYRTLGFKVVPLDSPGYERADVKMILDLK